MADEQPPHWAPFETTEDWVWFRTEVDALLDRIGLEHRWREGFLEIDFGGWPHTLSIVPIARYLLERVRREDWPAQLDRRLRDTIDAVADRDAVPPYAIASEQLRFRLRPLAEVPASHIVVGQPFADDLLSVVVLDDSSRVRSVDAPHVDGWGMHVDEVARVARRNTAAVPDLRREDITHRSGAQIAVLSTPESTYGAAQAIWVDEHLGDVGPHGALVAVPNRQICMLHRIVDQRVQTVFEWTRPWIDARLQAAGRISPHFYWWRAHDDIVRLPDERLDAVIRDLPPS